MLKADHHPVQLPGFDVGTIQQLLGSFDGGLIVGTFYLPNLLKVAVISNDGGSSPGAMAQDVIMRSVRTG